MTLELTDPIWVLNEVARVGRMVAAATNPTDIIKAAAELMHLVEDIALDYGQAVEHIRIFAEQAQEREGIIQELILRNGHGLKGKMKKQSGLGEVH